MLSAGRLWKRGRPVLMVAFGVGLTWYFSYYAVYGARGVFAAQQLDDRIAEARTMLDLENGKRAALERRVTLLRPDSLDPDLLEERARTLLNMGRSDEVVILESPQSVGKKPVRVTSP